MSEKERVQAQETSKTSGEKRVNSIVTCQYPRWRKITYYTSEDGVSGTAVRHVGCGLEKKQRRVMLTLLRSFISANTVFIPACGPSRVPASRHLLRMASCIENMVGTRFFCR